MYWNLLVIDKYNIVVIRIILENEVFIIII